MLSQNPVQLSSDPSYQTIKEMDRFLDESTFRLFLKKLNGSHLIQLIAINKEILHRKAKLEPKRLVWIDIDDTVITLFGEQEGAVNGIKDFLSFVKTVEVMIPPEYIIEGIRADCGFADPAVMSYAEEKDF